MRVRWRMVGCDDLGRRSGYSIDRCKIQRVIMVSVVWGIEFIEDIGRTGNGWGGVVCSSCQRQEGRKWEQRTKV